MNRYKINLQIRQLALNYLYLMCSSYDTRDPELILNDYFIVLFQLFRTVLLHEHKHQAAGLQFLRRLRTTGERNAHAVG